jgi:hypothetical protein
LYFLPLPHGQGSFRDVRSRDILAFTEKGTSARNNDLDRRPGYLRPVVNARRINTKTAMIPETILHVLYEEWQLSHRNSYPPPRSGPWSTKAL